jgi:ankyrin repeat protein
MASYFVDKGVPVGGQLCSTSAIRGSAIHLTIHQHSEGTLLNPLLIKDRQMGHPSFQSAISPIHIAAGSQNHTALRLLLQYGQKQNWIAPRKATEGNSSSSDTYSTSMSRIRDAHFPWKGTSLLCDVKFDSDDLESEWQLAPWQPNSPDPLTTSQLESGAPLHIAAFLGDLESAKILLEFGAIADSSDSLGNTPMHIAANSGSLEIIKLLVHNGANPNALNIGGESAAMLAAEFCHVRIVKYLTALPHYAFDPNYCDLLDLSILHQAVYSESKSCAVVVSHLLSLGCSPYLKDSYNKTPFEVALWRPEGQNGLKSLMLNWDIDFEWCAGILPEFSLSRISNSTVKRLLKRLSGTRVSTEIDKVSPYGKRGTLLAQAAIIDDPELLDALIRAGATLDLEGSASGTALLIACTGGRLSSVKYLVRAGANIFGARNGATVSAIQAAKSFPNIVQWLLVERYIDQRKICWSSCGDINQEYKWSGPVTVEVPTLGLYSPMHGASSFEKAVDLARLRKRLQGCVVHY